jgi:hypothetical protein
MIESSPSQTIPGELKRLVNHAASIDPIDPTNTIDRKQEERRRGVRDGVGHLLLALELSSSRARAAFFHTGQCSSGPPSGAVSPHPYSHTPNNKAAAGCITPPLKPESTAPPNPSVTIWIGEEWLVLLMRQTLVIVITRQKQTPGLTSFIHSSSRPPHWINKCSSTDRLPLPPPQTQGGEDEPGSRPEARCAPRRRRR